MDHLKSCLMLQRQEACWTISNITAGTKEQIQSVVEAGILPPLVHLLATAEFDIKKEAAWALSNATSGGTHEQVRHWSVANQFKSCAGLGAVAKLA